MHTILYGLYLCGHSSNNRSKNWLHMHINWLGASLFLDPSRTTCTSLTSLPLFLSASKESCEVSCYVVRWAELIILLLCTMKPWRPRAVPSRAWIFTLCSKADLLRQDRARVPRFSLWPPAVDQVKYVVVRAFNLHWRVAILIRRLDHACRHARTTPTAADLAELFTDQQTRDCSSRYIVQCWTAAITILLCINYLINTDKDKA